MVGGLQTDMWKELVAVIWWDGWYNRDDGGWGVVTQRFYALTFLPEMFLFLKNGKVL